MKSHQCVRLAAVLILAGVLLASGPLELCAQGDSLSVEKVVGSIDMGKAALLQSQGADGSWDAGEGHTIGVTSLATLALLNSGMTADDPQIKKALNYLREVRVPSLTYEVSLMLMTFAVAKDPKDKLKMQAMSAQIEKAQITTGQMKGCWSYHTNGGLIDTGGDRSNGQFAVLGLFEAANAGIAVDRETWKRARDHWVRSQTPDGGWGYAGVGGNDSTGSMTVAGIAVLVMTSAMLQDDSDLDAEGNPMCCQKKEEDPNLARALNWMAKRFAVGSNPSGGGSWLLYYLYGLERAGRFSGRRFFGEHDWYREGARFLIRGQDKRTGFWQGLGVNEARPYIGTSFALLFLSKGLAPVLMNKLKYETPKNEDETWNLHPFDVRNMTNHLTGMDRWPKLVTWQVLDMNNVSKHGGVDDLLQSPILYLSGQEAPQFTDQEIDLLKQYVSLGGFIFAVNNCNRTDFHDAMFKLVERMYPEEAIRLKRLEAGHAVFRSEHPLNGDVIELYGADFGCRTAIMYSPEDLACLWNKWSRLTPPKRPAVLQGRITKSMRVGANVIAYATGREPPNKLESRMITAEEGSADTIKRGLLQVAQLRHTGGWDTAPKAARNLLLALNRTVGLTASTKPEALLPGSEDLKNYSLVLMHGRHGFSMSKEEINNLRKYLLNGRVLFADACCGARPFDSSFREFARKLFPEGKLKRIDPAHEIFTTEIGHDLSHVRRRTPSASNSDTLDGNIITDKAFLEGIEIGGRLVVIYSKYDISCALERQASVACTGYIPDDAVRIAVNVVLYTMLQQVELVDP
ncbi:MAG: DUF4159 domain-containing protein [Planctomycetota bacterium]|nr:DUF4159 domain-containing protein [Planctomycetota bacterium]MDA1249913.1 DUF4159 domain-containing protein [Planctomycetota bacterium]